MEELTVDFRKLNTNDVRKSYYPEVKSVKSSIIDYDKTYTESSYRPTNLEDKFEQCLKESSERQAIQNEWMKKIMIRITHTLLHYPSNRLPPKETDPGSFILPCIIRNHSMGNTLADLGESISIMPYSLFKRLELGSLKPIKMTIEMADRQMQSLKGIKENVIVKISNFVFPIDFVVLGIMEDENVLIILGRPMLATSHAKIDVYELAKDKEEFSMMLCDPDKRMSIGLEEFVDIDDMWDDLDPGILSNEKATIEFLKSGEIQESDKKQGKKELKMSIGLEEFVDIDDMWDDLDPGIMSNEKATTEILKSGGRIQLHSLDNLQLSCKIRSQDIISLSPSELAKDEEEFSMTLCDPDKRMSIGLEEVVDIDDIIQKLGGNYQGLLDSNSFGNLAEFAAVTA
ncbi:retrovirus-related pol polyprotein from transposon TNT 1-94 [Tanacetum coccineum]